MIEKLPDAHPFRRIVLHDQQAFAAGLSVLFLALPALAGGRMITAENTLDGSKSNTNWATFYHAAKQLQGLYGSHKAVLGHSPKNVKITAATDPQAILHQIAPTDFKGERNHLNALITDGVKAAAAWRAVPGNDIHPKFHTPGPIGNIPTPSTPGPVDIMSLITGGPAVPSFAGGGSVSDIASMFSFGGSVRADAGRIGGEGLTDYQRERLKKWKQSCVHKVMAGRIFSNFRHNNTEVD